MTDYTLVVNPPAILRDLEVAPPEVTRTVQVAAPQGPAGPPGTDYITLTAVGALGGHRAVVGDGAGGVLYADAADLSHRGRVLGITTHAAADGAPVRVQVVGAITEPSWSWSAGAVYLGSGGLLTQTPPSAGFLQIIGVAYGATSLSVDLSQPIVLI